MKDDGGMLLIPLKRSVISLQVVRKPAVPHFLGVQQSTAGGEEAGWGLRASIRRVGCGCSCLKVSLTQGGLEGNSLSCSEPSRAHPAPGDATGDR